MRLYFNATTLLFTLLVSVANLSSATSFETMIAGRPVTVDLVRGNDLSPAPWPGDHFELTTETITTQANVTIYDLLTANGIEPDVEAFTVVYDLNPSLKQIDPLPNGGSLTLPKVVGGKKLQNNLRNGYLVMLTVDRNLREELAKSASDLQGFAHTFTGLSDYKFVDPSTRAAVISNIRALADWLSYAQKSFLQRTGPPLRRQTLLGMHDEALALNSILAAILNSQDKVTPGDQEEINAIYKDIQVQMKKYDNIMAGEPQVSDERYQVVVTIQNGDVNLVKNLQVYYAWEGLFRKPPKEPLKSQPFDGLGSGSSASLTIADYVIWAGRPDHPFPPLTDQKPISIGATGGSPRNVVLSVVP
jgi:hypothetical protein